MGEVLEQDEWADAEWLRHSWWPVLALTLVIAVGTEVLVRLESAWFALMAPALLLMLVWRLPE